MLSPTFPYKLDPKIRSRIYRLALVENVDSALGGRGEGVSKVSKRGHTVPGLVIPYYDPENDYVPVPASGSLEPGLLRVCKKIRREAGPIFFGENEFGISMGGGCDPALFWSRKVASVRKEFGIETRSFIRFPPLGDMKALNDWCEEYYTEPLYVGLYYRKLRGWDADHYRNLERKIITEMLITAKAMATRPWEEVNMEMEIFRKKLRCTYSND